MPRRYVLIENTPGYMPEDNDPPTFDSYSEAVNHVSHYYKELREEYVVTPIINGQFAYYEEGKDGDLGRIVEIMPILDAEEEDYANAQ